MLIDGSASLNHSQRSLPQMNLRQVATVGALALASLLSTTSLAFAQANGTNGVTAIRSPNFHVLGATQVTAASTFATTTFADLPNSSLTFTPQRDPNQLCAPGEPCSVPHLHVLLNLEGSKVTATYGACELFVNGALIANTFREQTSAAGEGELTIFADVAETVSGSQIVKAQCKSGDTNTYTVVNGSLYAEEIY